MTRVTRLLTASFASLVLLVTAAFAQAAETLTMKTSKGDVVIELFEDVAPGHVAQVKKLAQSGFYDGIIFHRVIEGFMAQTGDPTGTGRGGSNEPDLNAEFSNVPFDRGVVGMARAQDPNSANSQFFIMFDEGHFLNGQYTAFGRVVKGMDVIDQINKGEPPVSPDKIIEMR
ncbi:MAG: peptidylprolyl isomerase [Pseudomonadota bacterium]